MQELAGRTWPIAELSAALARNLAPVYESPVPLERLQAALSLAHIAEDRLVERGRAPHRGCQGCGRCRQPRAPSGSQLAAIGAALRHPGRRVS